MDYPNTDIIDRHFLNWESFQDFKEYTNRENLNCITINIRSLRKHYQTLIAYINDLLEILDIIVLVEINIKTQEAQYYKIPGYNAIHKCRENARGGGIMIYLKENLAITTQNYNFTSTENITISININNKEILLSAFYRPPNTNVNQFIMEINEWLQLPNITKNKHLIFLGDININYLDNNFYGADDYLNLIYTHGLYHTIPVPTRSEFLHNNLVETCLDHINTRLKPPNFASFIIKIKIADHYITGFIYKHHETQNTTKITNKNIKILSEKK